MINFIYMKMESTTPQAKVMANILKILTDKNLTQSSLCAPLDIAESNVSKLVNNKTKLSYEMLTKIATFLSMSVIDIITYPDKYVKLSASEPEPVEAILQIKLKKDKKDQVLKLVFGENNIEIFNK